MNLLLRPLVRSIARQPEAGAVELPTNYLVTVVCKGGKKAHVRAQLLQALTVGGLHLRGLDSRSPEDGSDRVEVVAELAADDGRSDAVVEQIVGRLSLEPSVTAARWRIADVDRD